MEYSNSQIWEDLKIWVEYKGFYENDGKADICSWVKKKQYVQHAFRKLLLR